MRLPICYADEHEHVGMGCICKITTQPTYKVNMYNVKQLYVFLLQKKNYQYSSLHQHTSISGMILDL